MINGWNQNTEAEETGDVLPKFSSFIDLVCLFRSKTDSYTCVEQESEEDCNYKSNKTRLCLFTWTLRDREILLND